MGKRNPGRRARSRKRRPSGHDAREAAAPDARAARPPGRSVGLIGDMKAVGERPRAPWHPLPLSELLILVGAIGAVVGWVRGYQSNPALLGAGVGAVAIGTVEVTLREHLGGFRPHTGMLAVIPAVVLHSAVVLSLLAAGVHVPRWLNYALLAPDAAVAGTCFKLLRARYEDARRERTLAGGR